MTWITDADGSRWVDTPVRKRRKSPRALRFANVKVGDQLVLPPSNDWYSRIPEHYVVTDLWFDPVAGQEDELKGRMVAIRLIGDDGSPYGHKRSHTIRGLASQRYRYADIDFIAQGKAFVAALEEGTVVGIGKGAVIRARPKLPGGRL